MAEYIDREALKKKFCEWCNKEYEDEPCEPDECPLRTMIIEAHAADVVEVRRGKWIEADSTRKGQKFVCSVCKGVSYYPQPTRSKNLVKHCGYSYCPHCLAKMDGKDGTK